MRLDILNCGLEPTDVAEAATQQTAVDILDSDVIKTHVKYGSEPSKRLEEGLSVSAAKYAEYTENTISKLQQAYLKKCSPR
jgi:hypothetical protein